MACCEPSSRVGVAGTGSRLPRINGRTVGVDFLLRASHAGCGLIGRQWMRTVVVAIAAWSLSASRLLAHGTETRGDDPSWTFDPWIVVPILLLGLLYALGSVVLGRRTRIGRELREWRVVAFLGGWISLVAALVSPLHWLGEHLFSFHMIEHEILMAVSAPLLVVAMPIGTLLWAFPRPVRLAAGRLLKRPVVTVSWAWLSAGRNATIVHGVAIWAWHAPVLFDAAVTSVVLHRLQHLSFLLTAILFWWSVFLRSNTGAAAWHVFVTMLHTSVLGALMALAPRVLYQPRTASVATWGLTPLEDQQLAGLIMWVPAGTIYAGAALVLLALWIRRSSETGRRDDALHPL
jgi:putative membrane protein